MEGKSTLNPPGSPFLTMYALIRETKIIVIDIMNTQTKKILGFILRILVLGLLQEFRKIDEVGRTSVPERNKDMFLKASLLFIIGFFYLIH